MPSTTQPEVVLPGYEAGIETSGVDHSRQKLKDSADRLSQTLAEIDPHHQPFIETMGCYTEDETWTYRCRCNFQIVLQSTECRYAMRSKGQPVLLGTQNSFPIATKRIQTAMQEFMDVLNSEHTENDTIGNRGHLTSCTFSSAWRDTPDADCVLTLHYDHPLEPIWNKQASKVCQTLRLRQLNGRSKGTLLLVKGYEDKEGSDTEATIRDTVYLLPNGESDNAARWRVSLEPVSTTTIPVHYDKPESVFYHPNPKAMTKALAWMLNRLDSISNHERPLSLLEVYCGCGAHTVALGKSGLVSRILAVESDSRLVRACHQNLAKNGLEDLVKVKQGDAGKWARETSRKRRRGRLANEAATDENSYDVLLVDPPRQGLDEEVCNMAMLNLEGDATSCFQNILYVSCGHRALLRDLERLSSVYEVVHCAQMDLFPRTDSIETLVHLRRREA